MSLTNDQLQNMLKNKIFNGKLSEYVKVNLKGKSYIYFNSNIIQFSCGDNMMHISGFCPALKIYELETAQRKAIAEKHSQLRTTQIEPLRKNIEKFKSNLK